MSVKWFVGIEPRIAGKVFLGREIGDIHDWLLVLDQ